MIGGGDLKRRQGGLACVAVDGKHDEACVQSRPTAFGRTLVEPLLNADVSKQYCECLAPAASVDVSDIMGTKESNLVKNIHKRKVDYNVGTR